MIEHRALNIGGRHARRRRRYRGSRSRMSTASATGWTRTRAEEQLVRARRTVKAAEQVLTLTDKPQEKEPMWRSVRCTWEKELKFEDVAVMVCDDDVLPLQSRLPGQGSGGGHRVQPA